LFRSDFYQRSKTLLLDRCAHSGKTRPRGNRRAKVSRIIASNLIDNISLVCVERPVARSEISSRLWVSVAVEPGIDADRCRIAGHYELESALAPCTEDRVDGRIGNKRSKVRCKIPAQTAC